MKRNSKRKGNALTSDLMVQISECDPLVREKNILANMKLVYSIIKRVPVYFLPQEDLIQYGIIGLIKAHDHFDNRKGIRFSTYAILNGSVL
ncbi:MAG: hypothetical protein A2161_13160 [Candidatus Schekmanbacteria bacterium RBG_13_48_7]|uniref:RNA polymerase sigma-70 region 2 domain-containing protein n=1 Tax=Candidatus Schekmanbacteria bacterium RBG_13_48_7 TaxID=1817878 RepID=A0A1F7RLK6_9BACT|nr:MAG: hypothetical protein A2161_13160 [Candidatus Schekmanbacteria bacterium RBG_13_48_7]